jgi:hypothetical protein
MWPPAPDFFPPIIRDMICNDLKRPANQPIDPERCPLCGHPNNCQLCASSACQGRCWCVELEFPAELLARVPEEFRNRACICRSCVEKFRDGFRPFEPS